MKTIQIILVFFLFSSKATCQQNDSVPPPPTPPALQAVIDSYLDSLRNPECQPVFEGGGEAALMKFIQKNLTYPDSAKNKNIQGIVYISFIITRTGEVNKVTILKSVHPLLDEEAKRVTNLTTGKWKPGTIKGTPVSTLYTLPIRFDLHK